MSYKNETEFENALIAKLTQLDNQWSRENTKPKKS